MKLPLHLPREVQGAEDALQRIELHTHMSMVTRGRGFRQTGKNSKATRIETIAERYYGS